MAAVEPAGKAKGIEIRDKKSYPLGIKDLSPVLRAIKDKNPDAFVGLTYPPDTVLASKQSKEIGFNPKVFFTAVARRFRSTSRSWAPTPTASAASGRGASRRAPPRRRSSTPT